MNETATAVFTGGDLNRRLSAGQRSSAQEKSAGKALMGLRHLKADDIGVLRYTRTSELGTQVKCTNHAEDASSRKQVNLWHRDQRVAVAKLARGQQKLFRNLIRVQNDKRRIQRQARIRKQRQVQNELRERAAREREEAQVRVMEMIRAAYEASQTARDMMPGGGDKLRPSLPEIDEESEVDIATSAAGTGASTAASPAKNRSSIKLIGSSRSSGHDSLRRDSDRNSSTEPSLASSPARFSPRKSPSFRRASQNTSMSQVMEAVVQANLPPASPSKREVALLNDNGGLISRPYFSREAKQPSRSHDRRTPSTDSIKELTTINPNKVLPAIAKSSRDHSLNEKNDGAFSQNMEDSVFEENDRALRSSTTSKAYETLPSKEKKKRKRSDSRNSKYHIGIANRTFRVPDYQAPAVTSVVRYDRNGEGSLVPSEVAVKPASEEYKLPSRRAEYMVSKALEWERKRQDIRDKKLQGFLGRMKEIEQKEKLDSRLAVGLDYGRQETYQHNRFLNSKDRPAPASSTQQPTRHKVHRLSESLEAYHLKGDVQDMKNCRYLRQNGDESELQDSGQEGGKSGAGRGRRGRRVSSWGVLGMPQGAR